MKKPSITRIHGRIATMLLLSVWMMCLSISVQAQTITLKQTDVPLETVLKLITSQTGYKFVYAESVIDTKQKVSVNIKSSDINAVLNAVFKGTKITFTIAEKQVALSLRKEAVPTQAPAGLRIISGTVTENGGSPLIGALVSVEGTSIGTYTGISGEYCLNVKDDPQINLTYRYMGMESHTEPIGSRSRIDVSLVADNVTLDQVVVTGYQTISKERSAGSYAIVGGAKIQDKAISRGSILESLEGTLAGLNVNLGAEGDKFLIRGITSINSNRTPLFIVDGVSIPSEMIERTLSGNDINNVTVLKDATAASIWGAQAANGVVVITTKSGSRNEKTEVTYNGSFSFRGMPDYSYNDMMSSSMFIKNVSEEFDPVGYPWESMTTGVVDYAVLPHEIPLYRHYLGEISKAECDAELNRLSGLDGRKEYEKYFMSNSWLTNHSVSLSGGSNNQTFYVSLGYQGQQGNSKEHTNEYRINARENINITKWLNLDLTLNASYGTDKSNLNQFTIDGNPGATGLPDLPYVVFYDNDGSELSLTNYLINESVRTPAQSLSGINLDYYPVTDFNNTTRESVSSNIRANAGLTIKIIKGLKYEGRFSYYTSSGKSETYTPSESYNVRLDRVYATSQDGTTYLPSSGGYFRGSDSYEDSYTVRNQFSYDNSFKEGLHQVTALLGQEINQRKSGNNSSTMRGYDKQTMRSIFYDDYFIDVEGVPDPVLMKIGSGRNFFDHQRYNQGETTYRFVSFYANAAYTYNNRYSLNASIRVDQSNLFGSDPSIQFKPIWSVGGVWNIRREKFMENSSWINDLQIRTSYGFAGNSPSPGQGGPYNIINATSDPTYSEFGLGYVISTPANNKLTWEKTRTWNLGASFSLFRNKLSGSLDLYNKKTTDLLASSPVNPSTGYTSVFQNIGIMTNKGIEISLNNRNFSLRDFVWDTGLNLSYNVNKIVEMYFPAPASPAGYVSKVYVEGLPAQTLFAYRWAGLDPADGAARVYDSQGNIVRNSDDIDDISAIEYMGTTVPPWSGSLTNIFRYKNFELSFMFVANLGHKMRNDTYYQSDHRFTSNIHNDFDKRWRQPGDEQYTNIPSFYKMADANERDGGGQFYGSSDINILDASYVKLRDLSVSYYLPRNVCQEINTRSIKVRVQASNLLTMGFNKEGIDPEAFSLRGGARYDRYKPSISASLLIEF
ncbi:MAG: SusC/RagA family TonB-linked outer membrane protein [Bacteroidales bacterium]|nr:SusC/RagA family TonB-linked outer membrane protein [Bacteroidales bacterium]MDD2425805.1 SusC/RagA family TonB-linked outer membrane protein [Bacteroidales bacterium]MDD3989524.1 SusC/RagA family TonB-linked outer membrane protein [Bacteroidales bacterium]